MGTEWEDILVDIWRCISVASGVVSSKVSKRIPVIAFAVLLIASCIVSEDIQRGIISFTHDILAQHVYTMAGMRRSKGVCFGTLDSLPKGFPNDCLWMG